MGEPPPVADFTGPATEMTIGCLGSIYTRLDSFMRAGTRSARGWSARFPLENATSGYTIPAATWPRSRSRLCSVLAQASATSMPLMAKCLRKKSG